MKSRIRNFAFVALAALALTATPYRAHAAVDQYLTMDGDGGDSGSSAPAPPPPGSCAGVPQKRYG
jgi:hypothetical protein